MTQYTDFGKATRRALFDAERSQKWLIEQIRERTGLYCDSAYLSHIFLGQREAPKIKAAICEILNISEGDDENN